MSRTSEEQKIDHQIALPNIRNYPDNSAPMESENHKDDDDDDERLDVVGTTDSHSDAAHGELWPGPGRGTSGDDIYLFCLI